jgi:hypothetical protein
MPPVQTMILTVHILVIRLLDTAGMLAISSAKTVVIIHARAVGGLAAPTGKNTLV